MFVSRRAVLALPVAVVLALGGCSLVEPSSAAGPLSGLAECALGHTWTQDFESVVPTITDGLAQSGIAATGVTFTGTQTLDWDEKSRMTVKADYTVSVTTAAAEEQVLTVTETHAGVASGAAYINGDVAIPRQWEDKITVESTADLSGAVQEASPYVIPVTTFDDTVGLIVTCDGKTMTIHPRGSKLTQTWTRAD